MKQKQKKQKKRLILQPFKIFVPTKDFNYPVILFEDVKDIDLENIFSVVLYRDLETKEWLLFLIKKDEDFYVVPIAEAIGYFLNEKVKSSIILMNTKFENIEKEDGKIMPFGRENINL